MLASNSSGRFKSKRPVLRKTEWVGTLSRSKSSWVSLVGAPKFAECVQNGLLVACFFLFTLLFIMTSVVAITAFLTATESRGWLTAFIDGATSGVFWSVVAMISFCPAIWFAYSVGKPSAIQFEFDVQNRFFRRTIAGVSGRQVKIEEPFDAIQSIRAYYVSWNANAGGFQVNYGDAIGSSIPSAELDKHLAWLKTHLGDVVQPEFRLDL